MIKNATKFLLFFCLLAGVFSQVTAQAAYDTVSVYDIQYVPDPLNDDSSPLLGDTVVVKGLVMTGPRDLWIGARWSMFIQDPDSLNQPWSGFFIVQNDTFETATNMGFLESGMICNFTGVVTTFSQFTQINLLTADPLVPVEILSAGNPLPDPVTLTTADLADRATGEQWESQLVRFEGATVVNNAIAGNWASLNDASGSVGYIAEYANFFRDMLNAGTYTWPANGTNLDVEGYVRDEAGSPGQVFTINPMTFDDLTILSNPPEILSVDRSTGAPLSSEGVTVSAIIIDNVGVASSTLHYSVDEGDFQTVAMTADADTFSADIPAQVDGAFVRYFVTAEDTDGDDSILPGDTSRAAGQVFFYDVRDGGLTIADLQDTRGYASDISGYNGYEVTVTGVVMTDSTDFIGDYYIQDAAAAWSGIWVNDGTFTHTIGDEVTVTGEVEENFGVTRIDEVSASDVTTAGVGAFEPVDVTTGELNNSGANREAYESVLVRVSNVTVSNAFPDGGSNFGEFAVDDGSGEVRVDDRASGFRGNLDSLYTQDATIAMLTGFNYFSFGNYKMIPRDSGDVSTPTSIEDIIGAVPTEFDLEQNYPNPFNPTTDIRYTIAKSGKYTLEVYNLLGQRVKVLADDFHATGRYQVRWDGVDNNGNKVGSGVYFYRVSGENVALTRKMILLK